ncbi:MULTISPECIES: CaiB/BaiF CoA transferase family protein [Citrobacter]|uniref:CaiB/BaiF CoA transferase family protein n=1 Tax=Citrobacter TaxID=544 RepID=UPI0019063895|nr:MULTISPECIES: CaiB/BaiF CoA-transferase family protein [Citrobacter]MBJ9865034.1 CoA transferase [Citrobacter amalonaticus]MDU7775399.1 CaiB/BaiF CoA-transferase family protein [Citrobacter sp.]
MLPLTGLVVLDFSQFLAGPSAALRLADMGARVIKVERPGGGDASRNLSLNNQWINNDSLLFHTINRGKESFIANLKEPRELAQVKKLIAQADILIENFRPGVMDKIGLGYEEARRLNPQLVYASVTGYGTEGPWVKKPGQDLLVQAMSGITWLNGNKDQPPTPFALSVADSLTGAHLVEGILACLIRRGKTRLGGRVEVSLMESLLSMQFEVLTTWLNDGHQPPCRSADNNAHAYLAAPYGIYATRKGYIALAMGSVVELGKILGSPALTKYHEPNEWFSRRDEIKQVIAGILAAESASFWLERLEKAGYWCAEVSNWSTLTASEGFRALDMTQDVRLDDGKTITMLKSPLRFNGKRTSSSRPAPVLGANTAQIQADFHLAEAD